MALTNSPNKKLIKKSDEKENICNCKSKTNCPVDNKCCLNNVRYQAKVSTSKDDYKVYIGSKKNHTNPDTINIRPLSLNFSKANPKIVPNYQTTYEIYTLTM